MPWFHVQAWPKGKLSEQPREDWVEAEDNVQAIVKANLRRPDDPPVMEYEKIESEYQDLN